MRRLPPVLVCLFLLLAHAADAQVRSTIIGPGEKRYPIAIAPLKELGGAPGSQGVFQQVVSRDLELSGLFRVVPPDTYIDSPQTGGTTDDTINFDNRSVI